MDGTPFGRYRLAGLLLIAAGVIGALPAAFFAVWGILTAGELG